MTKFKEVSQEFVWNNPDLYIQVIIKNVCGNELIYPANETGDKFARLLNVKSFNAKQIKDIESLGYQFDQVL